MKNIQTIKDMTEQYLKDYFDLIFVAIEDCDTKLEEIIEIKQIKDVMPSVLKGFSNHVIIKLCEIYNGYGTEHRESFNMFDVIKRIEGLEEFEIWERLKDDENGFLVENGMWKN